jgi:hypothetical protein
MLVSRKPAGRATLGLLALVAATAACAGSVQAATESGQTPKSGSAKQAPAAKKPDPYDTDGKTPGVPKNLPTCAFFRKAFSQGFPCPGSIINSWDGWQPPMKVPMLPITFGAKSQPVNPVNGASATQNVCWKTVGRYVIVGVFVVVMGDPEYSYPSYASGPHSGCADVPFGVYVVVEARPQLPVAKG